MIMASRAAIIRLPYSWRRLALNERRELIGREQSNDALAINEKGGGRLDTSAATLLFVLLHDSGVPVTVEAGIKGRGLQSYLAGEAFQVIDCEGANIFAALVGEQVLSVVPKTLLFTGTFGGLRRPVGLRPDEGKVPVDDFRLACVDILRR